MHSAIKPSKGIKIRASHIRYMASGRRVGEFAEMWSAACRSEGFIIHTSFVKGLGRVKGDSYNRFALCPSANVLSLGLSPVGW